MDGVMADTETHFIDWYEQEYGVRVPRENFIGVPESEALPDKDAALRYCNSAGFFRTASVMQGAVEAVKKLMEDYDVYVVSAAMEFPQSLPEKLEWLKEHFPFISWQNIVFCGDKSIVHTDYLIDDHCKNLDKCKGKPLMFSAGHNANFNHHTRTDNWQAVLNFFENEGKAV